MEQNKRRQMEEDQIGIVYLAGLQRNETAPGRHIWWAICRQDLLHSFLHVGQLPRSINAPHPHIAKTAFF